MSRRAVIVAKTSILMTKTDGNGLSSWVKCVNDLTGYAMPIAK